MTKRLTSRRPYLLTVATAIFTLALASCGSGDGTFHGDLHVTVEANGAAPRTEAPPATAMQAPTATIAPTSTETPYWAKQILPGMAMEQYPPVNTRTDYELKNTQEWLNGEPTTIADIRDRGRVVLVDFWTYT